MTYSVDISARAQRELRKVSEGMRSSFDAAFRVLADDPRPPAARRLGDSPAYRLRVGDYRLVYEVDGDVVRVVLVALGHRHSSYRWHGTRS